MISHPFPRDEWGFQPQRYLEASSYHSRNPDDPWLEYRLPDGEFKLWLHTWCYLDKMHGGGVMGRPHGPLPWLFNVRPDGEFLSGLYHTGYTKKMPHWHNFEPPSNAQQLSWGSCSAVHGKLYGAVFKNFQEKTLDMYLRSLRKQFVTNQDFYAALNARHCLYSRNVRSR